MYMHFWGWVFQVKVKLKPLKDLEQINKKTWLSLSDDPHFHLKTPSLKQGWYLIRIKSNVTEFQTAKLYPHHRKQHVQEESAIILPIKPHRDLYKVIHLSESKMLLRFDPQEIPGEFSIEKFQLIRIPYIYALFRQLKRLQKLNNKFKKLSLLQIFKLLTKQAAKIDTHYTTHIHSLYRASFHRKETGKNYTDWLKHNEKRKILRLLENKGTLNTESIGIAIILPVYNTPLDHLKQCVNSVINQTHNNWQLCIVDDASTLTAHIDYLQKLSAKDSRITFKVRKANGHISKASNDALSMCDKPFTLLLDHDDELSLNALKIFAISIIENPEALIWYADEDKIDEAGYRFMPHFKTDWNPDLLYSQNYIGHPVIYKTKRLRQIGGFREGYEGSQDHDLLLRYTNNLTKQQIIHIPWILYHWRAIETSTALHTDAKNYTNNSGIKALQDFFQNQNKRVKVSAGAFANTYRCNWPLPEKPPLVSIIIPTRDGYEILEKAISSILKKTSYTNYEIIIIDNQSTCKKTLNYLAKLQSESKNIRILSWNKPFNYSAINNYGVEKAYGEIVALVNNDIEVISTNWLTEMVANAVREDIGCVGAKLYYSNDTIQHAGAILGIGGVAGHAHKHFKEDHPGYFSRLFLSQNYSAVTAACLVVQKHIFNAVGGLNEENLAIAFNDIDFCLKVQKLGLRNLFTPWAELYHHESISRGKEDTPAKLRRFRKEVLFMKTSWPEELKNDPYYNRNLTLEHENFGLR